MVCLLHVLVSVMFVGVRVVAMFACLLFYVLCFGVVAVVWLLFNAVLCLSDCSLCVWLCVFLLLLFAFCGFVYRFMWLCCCCACLFVLFVLRLLVACVVCVFYVLLLLSCLLDGFVLMFDVCFAVGCLCCLFFGIAYVVCVVWGCGLFCFLVLRSLVPCFVIVCVFCYCCC